MRTIIILSLLLFANTVKANDVGSVYVSKLDTKVRWEGNQTGATRDSIFKIDIDGKYRKSISSTKDAKFEELKLGQKHYIKIILDGKAIESFYFNFEDFECDQLWLYYKEMYGTWTLRTSSWNCKRK